MRVLRSRPPPSPHLPRPSAGVAGSRRLRREPVTALLCSSLLERPKPPQTPPRTPARAQQRCLSTHRPPVAPSSSHLPTLSHLSLTFLLVAAAAACCCGDDVVAMATAHPAVAWPPLSRQLPSTASTRREESQAVVHTRDARSVPAVAPALSEHVMQHARPRGLER
ncbi:hypothetical protein FB107DRAFT_280688 [Schizophyllum commune]